MSSHVQGQDHVNPSNLGAPWSSAAMHRIFSVLQDTCHAEEGRAHSGTLAHVAMTHLVMTDWQCKPMQIPVQTLLMIPGFLGLFACKLLLGCAFRFAFTACTCKRMPYLLPGRFVHDPASNFGAPHDQL